MRSPHPARPSEYDREHGYRGPFTKIAWITSKTSARHNLRTFAIVPVPFSNTEVVIVAPADTIS